MGHPFVRGSRPRRTLPRLSPRTVILLECDRLNISARVNVSCSSHETDVWLYYLGSSGNRVGSWKDVGGSQGSPLLCKEGVGREKEAQPLDASTPPCLPLPRGG